MAVGAALLASVAAPAAAHASPTTVTFTIQAGALTISSPAAVNLGNAVPGSPVQGTIGPVTVTDARGALVATWTATAASTAFTTGAGSTAETVPNTAVSYASGVATTTTGVGVFTPGQATVLLAQPLGTPKTAYTLTAGVGVNSATWNPTLIVNVPAAAVAGTYTGTVTHSVA